MTAQALADKYFAEYKQLCVHHPDIALNDYERWNSISVTGLLEEPAERQKEFADYVVQHICARHSQEIIQEFAGLTNEVEPRIEYTKTSEVGNTVLLLAFLEDGAVKKKLQQQYDQMKKNTLRTERLRWWWVVCSIMLYTLISSLVPDAFVVTFALTFLAFWVFANVAVWKK